MDESKKIPENFCVMPFIGGHITTRGIIKVCCTIDSKSTKNYFNIKQDQLEEWLNSDYRKNLQKKFLNNDKPEECKNCWNKERNNELSLRLSKNRNYKLNYFKTIHNFLKRFPLTKNPIEWEMSITNICNLKCQMCTGSDSSKLLVENKEIFKSSSIQLSNFEKQDLLADQKDFNINDKELEAINKIFDGEIREINFRGGEPLLIPKIEKLLLTLVKKDYAKNLILHISTNGTIISDKILEIFKNFKKIRLMVSVESTNKQNDYIRFPSTWNSIKKNITRYKSLKNLEFYINTTVSNLNLLYLDQLIVFSMKHNFFTKLELVETPNYMHFSVLPKVILEKSLEKLLKVEVSNYNFNKIENFKNLINSLQNHINNYNLDEDKWKMFVQIIQLRDAYRKVHIQDYMPELSKVIYN